MRPRQRFVGVSWEVVEAVAALFATEPERQPFDLPANDLGVWQVQHRSESGNLRVLLWPGIDRVDVVVGPHMWVVKSVREVEVIDGLEWIARFAADGVLTVALGGQVVLVTPSEQRG